MLDGLLGDTISSDGWMLMTDNFQTGSTMIEVVIFLALASLLFMIVVGQLVFMVKVSRQEDARVQALMAARVKIEELRSGLPAAAFSGDSYFQEDSFPDDFFQGLNMLHNKTLVLNVSKDPDNTDLYEAVVKVEDASGALIYSTQTTVWLDR